MRLTDLPRELTSRSVRESLAEKIRDAEKAQKHILPPGTYTIVRVDGRAFSTLTKNLTKPFDDGLADDMDAIAVELAQQSQGAVLAYTQSDEVSLILAPSWNTKAEPAFGGVQSKLISHSAALATAVFNSRRRTSPLALFDARVFSLAGPSPVNKYLAWRQAEAVRSSIETSARYAYGKSETQGMSVRRLLERLETDGQAPAARHYLGRIAVRRESIEEVTYVSQDTSERSSSIARHSRFTTQSAPVLETDGLTRCLALSSQELTG